MSDRDKSNLQLEAATVYFLASHQIILEELKLKLRLKNIKATKSQLVRVAVQFLGEQPLSTIIDRLRLDMAE